MDTAHQSRPGFGATNGAPSAENGHAGQSEARQVETPKTASNAPLSPPQTAQVSSAPAPILWLPSPDELALLRAVINDHDAATNVIPTLDPTGFSNDTARRIFGACKAVWNKATPLSPASLAAECQAQRDASAEQSECALWSDCEAIALSDLATLPAMPDMAKGAAEIAKRLFRVTTSDIPVPSMRSERGKAEYEAGQLVPLICPGWTCAALSSHAAHAERILAHIGGDLRFSPQLGWLTFNGRQWQRDDRHATQTADRAKALSQVVREEGGTLYGLAGVLARAGRGDDAFAMSQAAAAHTRHAKQVETKNFVEGALHFAAGAAAIRVAPDAFDQRPWLLGFENGVWDAGEWREHRREDFLLHLCPVALDKRANQSEWRRVLDCMTGGDEAYKRTLQDAAGYILSGASHLRFLPWLYGPKGTGKSTFAELLQTVLGRMAATIDPKKLHDDTSRERLGADLWNRRLAVCAEAGGQKLESELLKTLSGADSLTVRFLYQEAFDALPRHVLLMVSNDAPRLDAYDDALKDRVVALPFVHALDAGGTQIELTGGARIEAVRKDPASPLVRGFAAWALEGLARVFETQIIFRAPCIEAATAKFWADTDPLTPFWETLGADELRAGISKTDLRKRYEHWCEVEGARPFNRNQWARACHSFGLSDFLSRNVRGWRLTQLTQLSDFPENPYEA